MCRDLRRVAALCIAVTAIWMICRQPGYAQERPARRALLVNATRSKNQKDIDPLGDSAEDQLDGMIMTRALKEKGFTVTLLENDSASLAKIKTALDDLAQVSKPGDVVVFYFSGHGAAGKDQLSLCPWDADSKTDSNDLTETDLKAWLDKLKTRNVTLILDSCYSQVAANGRPLSPRHRVKSIRRQFTGPEKPAQQFHISPDQAVIISAANENGVALQISPVDNSWSGLFTYKLGEELLHTTGATTYRELGQAVCRDVQKWTELYRDDVLGKGKIVQTPTVYGSDALLDRPLFAPVPEGPAPPKAEVPPAAKPIGTVATVGGDRITLQVGENSDLPVGSRVGVLGQDGQKHAFTVTRVNPGTADTSGTVEAVPTGATVDKSIMPDAPAVPIRVENNILPTDVAGKITVRLDGSPEFQAKMIRALSLYSYLNPVTGREPEAQLIIKGELTADGIRGKMLEADGVSPVDPRGRGFSGKDADELVDRFSTELNQLAIVAAMLKLKNPGRPFIVSVASAQPQYKIGDNAAFSCTADKDCYIFLYTVDSTGYPSLLYPLDMSQSNLLKRDQTLKLPPPGSDLTFPVTPPFGAVKIGVLAVLDPAVAETLKKRLLMESPSDTGNHSGSRGIRAVQDLQKLQLGPLEGWMINELDVAILKDATEKAGAKP